MASPDDVPAHPGVSAVMAVRDESRHLRAAVEAILGQDYTGEIEIAVAVGPSRDDTEAVAQALADEDPRVRVLANPSGRTAAGLNRAIAATSYPIVARVDGHAILPQHYLRTAVDLLYEVGADNVGGMMAAEGTTPFERAVAAAMTSRFGVGNAPFHHGGKPGPVDTVYLGVFRRDALARAGGYDERFVRAQDYELNVRIRAAGGQVWFTPELRVTYRPRQTLGALAKQYLYYGRWRRALMRHHPTSVRLRYLAPPAALVGSVAGGALAATGRRWALALPGAYLAVVATGSVALGRHLPPGTAARLPLVLVTMHGSWGVGFLTSRERVDQ